VTTEVGLLGRGGGLFSDCHKLLECTLRPTESSQIAEEQYDFQSGIAQFCPADSATTTDYKNNGIGLFRIGGRLRIGGE